MRSCIVFFKEIWIVTRGMQSYYPELITTSTTRPNLYHGSNICLHVFVFAFRLFSFCLLLHVVLTVLILLTFLTFKKKKKGDGASMVLLYLQEVCFLRWRTLAHAEFYIMSNLVYPQAATIPGSPLSAQEW